MNPEPQKEGNNMGAQSKTEPAQQAVGRTVKRIEPAQQEHGDLDLAMEHSEAPVADDAGPVAPVAPGEFDPPWVNKNEAAAPPVEEAPREKVDFENLPEFVQQRQMLKVARLAAIGVVTVIVLGLLIYFFVTTKATKDSVEDIIKDPAAPAGK